MLLGHVGLLPSTFFNNTQFSEEQGKVSLGSLSSLAIPSFLLLFHSKARVLVPSTIIHNNSLHNLG